jgi:putative DNA methylase
LDYPKRLIEVDLPIKRISAHARREKSIRHGHISTLHIWWARRPLAACRAVICAALWPDPADENCPPAFRDEARRLMTDWAKNHLDLTSPESMSRFNRVKNDPKVLADNVEVRKALLDFIADFANWDNSAHQAFLQCCRSLTKVASRTASTEHNETPVVVDPFAGGGSIPLEALRCGGTAFASDLNPIPILLNKVALDYIPKYANTLAAEVRKWGNWIQSQARKQLAEYYPPSDDGAIPLTYLWARTVRCEGPACGASIPLLRSRWIARNSSGSVLVDFKGDKRGTKVVASLVHKPPKSEKGEGTCKRGAVTCPCCGYTTPASSVRKQLTARRGGADDAMLYCVVARDAAGNRVYRAAAESDLVAARQAATRLDSSIRNGDAIVPHQDLPVMSGVFNAPLYGMTRWRDLFSARQLLALTTIAQLIRNLPLDKSTPRDFQRAIKTTLCSVFGRQCDYSSSLVVWANKGEFVAHTFGRQALPMVFDFAEPAFLEDTSGSWGGAVEWVVRVLEDLAAAQLPEGSVVSQASASAHPLPDDSVDAAVTDPPYYNAVPYADLSDFFYVWARTAIGDEHSDLLAADYAPKEDEICEMAGWDPVRYSYKTGGWFEERMQLAMAEMRRILRPQGIGVVVFAHKSTAGWENQIRAMLEAGWVFTASWPIDTERPGRLRAQKSAALASSVHLVCRPRETADGHVAADRVGDWRTVLAELPKRIHEWMPRLAEEGVVGADAIFACLGPALEIFSRYSRVEKASGEVVTLREYLEQVWAAVSTEALSMIFRDADAAGLESDARFTAIVLWTLGAGGSTSSESGESDSGGAEEEDDEDESPKGKAAKGGYTLEYDAARKIAQGLGVNLEQIDSVVEVKGDKARLRPVSERATALFGKAEKTEAATKKRGKKAAQKKLFDKDAEEGGGTADTVTIGEGVAATPGVTALDRVHQAMLLFASGRADALKRFIVEDGVGGDSRFWKLAQSLSALYPAGSDEKRWVDGVLARKKSFGF